MKILDWLKKLNNCLDGQEEIKLCKDCRWFLCKTTPLCVNPEYIVINVITGEKNPPLSCSSERYSDFRCGINAKGFTPIDKVEGKE